MRNADKPCNRCNLRDRAYDRSYCQECINEMSKESLERNKNKPCSNCHFNPRLSYSTRCRDCKLELHRKSVENKGGRAAVHRLYTYGMTQEEYDNLCNLQGGICANKQCDNPIEVVDHCHTTDVIRGLLCQPCNKALGFVEDNVSKLLGLIDYLKEGVE